MRSFEVVDSRILVEVDCEVPPGGSQHTFSALVHIEPGSPDYAVILGLDILVHYDITISGGKCTITAPMPDH